MAHIEYSLDVLKAWTDFGNEGAKELYKEKKEYLGNLKMKKSTIKLLNNYDDNIKVLNILNKNIRGILNLGRFDNLEELYCSNNKITEIINIPKTLKYLNCENNKITKLYNLPDNLTGINCKKNQLNELYYPFNIKPNKWPSNLKHLIVNSYFDGLFDNLPKTLIYLEIPYNDTLNNKSFYIPNNIKNILHIKDFCLSSLQNFNCIINHIIFYEGENYNIDALNNLPNSIEYIDFPCIYPFMLDNLPNSIKSINIYGLDKQTYNCVSYDDFFDNPINNLPKNLKELKIESGRFNQTLDNLPDNLETLEISGHYDSNELSCCTEYYYYSKFSQPINKLPKKLKKLTLHFSTKYCNNIKINYLPEELIEFNLYVHTIKYNEDEINIEETNKHNDVKIIINDIIDLNKKINFNDKSIYIKELQQCIKQLILENKITEEEYNINYNQQLESLFILYNEKLIFKYLS
jgi:hypothetical protein